MNLSFSLTYSLGVIDNMNILYLEIHFSLTTYSLNSLWFSSFFLSTASHITLVCLLFSTHVLNNSVFKDWNRIFSFYFIALLGLSCLCLFFHLLVYNNESKSIFWFRIFSYALELYIFWPPDAKNWLIWKDPDVGKDWRQEEEGMTEDEIVRWHHRLNGHEFG